MKQYRRVPFDIELAKKVQAKEVEGRVQCKCGISAHIVDYILFGTTDILVIRSSKHSYNEGAYMYTKNGEDRSGRNEYDLVIDLIEEVPVTNSFFLNDDAINMYFRTPGYELTLSQLGQEWKIDPKPRYRLKDCYNFHAKDGCYIEIKVSDLNKVFTRKFELPDGIDVSVPCDFKSAWPVEEKKEHEFKPFEWVLVRASNLDKWKANLFSHMDDGYYKCVNSRYAQCIPYEGNEHLLGTTNNPE